MKKDYKISVAGTYYHQKALKSLQTEENYDYSLSKAEMFAEGLDADDRIYQYGIEKCLLDIKHEPGNQYDPAALQVFADGVLIGYVPRGNLDVLKRIASHPDLEMHVEIYGGKYKVIEEKEPGADWMCEYNPKDYVVRIENSEVRAMMVFEWTA